MFVRFARYYLKKGGAVKAFMVKVWIFLIFVVSVAGALDDPFSVDVTLDEIVLTVSFTVPEKHYLYNEHLAVEADGAVLVPLTRPAPVKVQDPFMDAEMEVFKQDFLLQFIVQSVSNPDFPVTVRYMGCDDQICFMPQTRVFHPAREVLRGAVAVQEAPGGTADGGTIFDGFDIIGFDAGFRNVSEFLAFLERVDRGEGLQRGTLEQLFERYGILIGIVFTLGFGFLLNLTPCVLPMIPINLAIIGAGSQAGSRARGFGLGAVYGVGIALVYGLLGVVVVLTGAQFGALNANPWFNLGIALVFLLLSLAMFDVFHIDFSRFQTMVGQNKDRGPVWTALLFGGVAALLAGACVAPAVISVLVLSTGFYQAGHPQALLLPFVLGIGMALPWPFAGAGLSFLPKPGRWMEWVKKGFGVLILGFSIYYGHLGASLQGWLQGGTAARTGGAEAFWLHDPAVAVDRARESGQDLFVDFWATWCKSCMEMDRTTFKDESVRAALAPYVRLKFQAEDPFDPETKRVLDLLGVKGLPSYVILRFQ
jgi:thioredoxin:protein disulfide reductase